MQQLHSIHHITCICADAPGNVEFYARTLGLRLVKQTVNFDAPDVYHLYYGDEHGSPGSILTFFEFPHAAPGRAGAGMIHRLQWRVSDEPALGYWAERLARQGVEIEPGGDQAALAFRDPEGLGLEIRIQEGDDAPLRAPAIDIPAQHALLGFHGVRAYVPLPVETEGVMTDVLGFEQAGERLYRIEGGGRHAFYEYDLPPRAEGIQGAGTVHHIAWATPDDEQEDWRRRLIDAGARVTQIIDRQYFHSIYFREPRGVLFEIATLGPGFAIDEDPGHLGEELRLPPQHEPLRASLEQKLTPIVNPLVEGGGRA
jgi:glyoxalase family protein